MPKGESNAVKNSYKDGKWNVNYLRFLVDFMDEMGAGTTEVAEKLGLSRVSIYYWLRQDDAKISAICKVFEAYGYNIAFSLEKDRPTGEAQVSMNIKRPVGDKRLSFLDDALNRYRINRGELLKKLQLGATTLCYWMKADDIYMSYIYKIAEASGLVLTIDITPKK